MGKPGKMNCGAGKNNFWIDWQGYLYVCGLFPGSKVDLHESSFEAAWRKNVQWAEELEYCSVCGNCVNRKMCVRCATMIVSETGDYATRPEYLCERTKFCAIYYREFAKRGDVIALEEIDS